MRNGGIRSSDRLGFEVNYLFNASRRDTLKAIYELSSEVAFSDHLLVYYAGHGVRDDVTDTAYWIPSDAPRDLRFDWISADEILTGLKAISLTSFARRGQLLQRQTPKRRGTDRAKPRRGIGKALVLKSSSRNY